MANCFVICEGYPLNVFKDKCQILSLLDNIRKSSSRKKEDINSYNIDSIEKIHIIDAFNHESLSKYVSGKDVCGYDFGELDEYYNQLPSDRKVSYSPEISKYLFDIVTFFHVEYTNFTVNAMDMAKNSSPDDYRALNRNVDILRRNSESVVVLPVDEKYLDTSINLMRNYLHVNRRYFPKECKRNNKSSTCLNEERKMNPALTCRRTENCEHYSPNNLLSLKVNRPVEENHDRNNSKIVNCSMPKYLVVLIPMTKGKDKPFSLNNIKIESFPEYPEK